LAGLFKHLAENGLSELDDSGPLKTVEQIKAVCNLESLNFWRVKSHDLETLTMQLL
jgi:hypothetical protein